MIARVFRRRYIVGLGHRLAVGDQIISETKDERKKVFNIYPPHNLLLK